MITQGDANDVCSLMYHMRDSIGDHDVRRALELSKELYDRLLKMTVEHEQLKCVLECDLPKKEK